MYEYLILIVCFGLLIVVRMFLFKRSYTRKMSFYSDPDDFANEFIQNLDSQAKRNPVIKKQFMSTDNLLKIMDLNFKKLPPLSLIFFFPFQMSAYKFKTRRRSKGMKLSKF